MAIISGSFVLPHAISTQDLAKRRARNYLADIMIQMLHLRRTGAKSVAFLFKLQRIQRGIRNYFIRKKNFKHMLEMVYDKAYIELHERGSPQAHRGK
jgi:chromosome condensin MukBEF complex kleisin-like MukF subunit